MVSAFAGKERVLHMHVWVAILAGAGITLLPVMLANAALDITRRKKVRDADTLADTIASPFRDPAESAELRRRLTVALTTLNERQRAVIVLHDVEGFKHAEIGTMLGIPEGTARSDLHHARARLRQALSAVRSEL